ncbi:ATP-binding cassette sub-family C member 5-like [Ylistrum balloti]|uniref:ATP-binding cassette sub-family C member 5-like n=1 Tax=Ylistrum balloti TaxID=509963 RepID=UPI0029058BC8|nr:ATP-binding cassette sub-family C member 5-like [Ylistrum balloti]
MDCFLELVDKGLCIRFRSGILGLAYKKLLKLKHINGRVAAEVITIFGSDALRVFMNTKFFVFLLSAPVYLIIGIAYLYYLLGIWCVIAFATLMVFCTIQIRKLTEVISNIKLLKMHAWEKYFRNTIIDIRTMESKPLLQSAILSYIANAIIPLTPSLATVTTITAYVYAGNELDVSTGFSVVATLTYLKVIVAFVPYAAEIFGQTLISFERIKGKHIGICGALGCGKSSLLQALIGRMPLITGHLAINGSVAYAAQQAWIFNGSVRENVLFGSPYEEDWYTEVVNACSLKPDLNILANGDMTEIGDRGMNLSGGQKQRVSLARAVYSKRDIYLLDDPLSAVDVQVGQHLFKRCIDGVLKNKTVLLVTHQLQYLEHCDEIYVMSEGVITEHGSHDALLAQKGCYTKLMEQFNSNLDHHSTIDDKIQCEYETKSASLNVNKRKQETGTADHGYEKGILTDREKSVSGTTTPSPVMNSLHSNGTEGDATGFGNVSMLDVLTYTSLSSGKEHDESDWYLTIYISTAGVMIGLAALKGIITGIVYIRATVNLHNNALRRVMSSPMRYFDANPTGRILNRFSQDVEEVDVIFPFMLDNLLQTTVMIVASLGTIIYSFPWILIAVSPIMLFFYVIVILSSVSMRGFKRLENVARSPLLNHVTTTCNGISTITTFSQETNFMDRCKQYTDTTSMALLLYDSCMRWMGLTMDIGGAMVAMVTMSVVLFTKDSISPTLATLALTMSLNVTGLAQSFASTFSEVDARFTCIERILEYEGLDKEKETGSDEVEGIWPSQGRITFSNVVMKYRADLDPVLKNISFDILPKQKIGIVGRTGAGKSSLSAALFRLTDLKEGHVMIDGIEIGAVSRKLLRSNLSSIPQDPVLFAGTLRYNLDPFEKYTDTQMWAALEQVHMKEKMKLRDQTLDMYIEENGENFSVGERQLISLARAILRQNKILILDEATASIDTSTDAKIQQTIRNSFSDCTVLTIAHRLNTVLHCDLILVMEGGRLIEKGSPKDLLQNPSSHFSNMIRFHNMVLPDN